MNRKILFSLVVLTSCVSNKGELPEPKDAISNGGSIFDGITYKLHVKQIIDNNCVDCHGSSGGVNLETYELVKQQADNGRILDRAINGQGGPMPPSGLLSQLTLDTLKAWLDKGALE